MEKPWVLMTAFEPFLNFKDNPSQQIIEFMRKNPIDDIEIKSRVLPVSYNGVSDFCKTIITKNSLPSAIVMTGLNHRIDHIALEQRALNWQKARYPDNDGVHHNGELICEDGPDQLESNLDLQDLSRMLSQPQQPVKVSLYAGTYVCNALYYHMLRKVLDKHIPCVFVHLPLLEKNWQLGDFSNVLTSLVSNMASLSEIPWKKERSLNNQSEAESFLYRFINYEARTGVAYTEEHYSLDRFRDFLGDIDHPENGQKYIHIAGTKGKGAV
ncbi:hypothetical protein K8T06_15595, partial [bacterium]|nr:hypothetical protein [bacterium]